MNREDALALFIEQELKCASAEFLSSAMTAVTKENKQQTAQKFAYSMLEAIRQAPSLYFLQLVLLRGRALLGMPFYRFDAYGKEFYLQDSLAAVLVELDWLYQPYQLFQARLDNGSKKYMGKIREADLERIKSAQLWICQKIVRHLFFEALPYLLQSDEYQALDSGKKVQFHLGEYRGEYEVLFTKEEATEKIGGLLCGIFLDQRT